MSHCKFVALLLICACVMTSAVYAQTWQLSFGNEKNQVAFYNAGSPGFKEDASYGPLAFRVVKDRLWLIDSVAGRILAFDSNNSVKTEVKIVGLPENTLLEDFALVVGAAGNPETVWVADAADCTLRKISLANGRELVKIGGNGNESGRFLQISQLEVDRGGRLYVCDIGRQIIAIFTPYGELIREMPCQRSGFAVDDKGNLHLLDYSSRYGYLHRVYSHRGQLTKVMHLGMRSFQNPRIWGLGSQGSLLVSFMPQNDYAGRLKLLEFNADAVVRRRCELAPVISMNRFVEPCETSLWLAEADFAAAPAGQFKVKRIDWDVK